MNLNKVNIVIPAAGLGSRFLDYGFKETKFLLPIDINLTPMIEKAIKTLILNSDNIKYKFIFILRLTHSNKDTELENNLYNICNKLNSECFIKWIDYVTEGPASSAYLAKELINEDIPLIISNSDQILDWNFSSFLNKCKEYDGCVLTYNPPYEFNIGDKDKHSFVKFDENNKPIEFVEKQAISKEALVGVHYYKNGHIFLESYNYLYKNNIRAPNGEFYLSYTYQALLNTGYTVGTYKLSENEYFYPVGEPDDYFNYYNKYCPIENYNLCLDSNTFILNKFKQYNNLFTINFNNIDEEVEVNNKLFILINGKTNLNTSIYLIKNCKIKFFEKTTFILFNLNNNIICNKEIDIKEFTRGWIIGDFIPSIEINRYIEIAYLNHEKLSKWDYHYHKESIEINILVKGKEIINGIIYKENDIFIINKNIIACPIFLENCDIICIKIPSVPNDKYII